MKLTEKCDIFLVILQMCREKYKLVSEVVALQTRFSFSLCISTIIMTHCSPFPVSLAFHLPLKIFVKIGSLKV